jgi:hypothetical protein
MLSDFSVVHHVAGGVLSHEARGDQNEAYRLHASHD